MEYNICDMRTSPAQHVVNQFGGLRRTARKLGLSHTAVWLWLQPASRRGSGGKIPNRLQSKIRQIAIEEGRDITYEDLIDGRFKPPANIIREAEPALVGTRHAPIKEKRPQSVGRQMPQEAPFLG